MKLKLFIFLLFTITLIVSCTLKKQQCKAKIIERKFINDSLLMINYSYEIEGKFYFDSIKTANKQLETDSIIVEFSINNPKQNQAILP